MNKRTIGMRTLKTAISLGICMLVYIIFKGLDNIITVNGHTLYSSEWNGFRFSDLYSPFFAGIAAAYSLYPSKAQSKSMAKNRVIASLLGGLIGMVVTIGYGLIGFISGNDFFTWPNLGDNFSVWQYLIPYTINFFGIIAVVVVGNLINKRTAIFVGILTYISVTINPMGMIVNRYNDLVPFLGEAIFGTNRILSTVVGVLISLAVNFFTLPHKTKNKDLLFVVGIEGMLKDDYEQLRGFMNYKINKANENGVNLTLFTTRIPSTFMYLLNDVSVTHPVCCMSGAALYDTKEHKYLYTETIPFNIEQQIDFELSKLKVTPFKNYIRDDVLYTYISKVDNIGEEAFYNEKKNAAYSNMILGVNRDEEPVLHYLLCEEVEIIDEVLEALKKANLMDYVCIQVYDSFLKNLPNKNLKFVKIYSKEIEHLNVLKKYAKLNNLRIVGLTTSTMADNLLNNSEIKISTSDTEIDGAIKCRTRDSLFEYIDKIYYSKKYSSEKGNE